MTAYLKCKYYEGFFALPREYCIFFKSSSQCSQRFLVDDKIFPPKGEKWCVVNRKEVIPVEGNNGIAKIIKISYEEDEKNAIVWIKDDGNMRISHYRVPIEEIETKIRDGEKVK